MKLCEIEIKPGQSLSNDQIKTIMYHYKEGTPPRHIANDMGIPLDMVLLAIDRESRIPPSPPTQPWSDPTPLSMPHREKYSNPDPITPASKYGAKGRVNDPATVALVKKYYSQSRAWTAPGIAQQFDLDVNVVRAIIAELRKSQKFDRNKGNYNQRTRDREIELVRYYYDQRLPYTEIARKLDIHPNRVTGILTNHILPDRRPPF